MQLQIVKRKLCRRSGGALPLLLLLPLGLLQAEDAAKPLTIGTTGTLGSGGSAARQKAALESLKDFIKVETGLDDEIAQQKDWRELAEKMSHKQISIGVYQGHEFAWAQGVFSTLKPLVLASNGSAYTEAFVVTRRENAAPNFAGLQGQSFARITSGSPFPWFYVERQTLALEKKPAAFFSKIITEDNVEDALDDLVDGKVDVAAVDRTGLEAYKNRKPGRFAKLKDLVHSAPALPVVIAYTEGALPEATLDRFRNGLLKANEKERGQTLLTLFHLTGFVRPPADFEAVLKTTLQAYPAPEKGK